MFINKLRDSLGDGSYLLLSCIIGFVIMFLFEIHEFISMLIGFIASAGIFSFINKLADLNEIQEIKRQQDAFNMEFYNFKKRYSYILDNSSFLLAAIDEIQCHTIKFCNEYPNKYLNTNDFKKITYMQILFYLSVTASDDGCSFTKETLDAFKFYKKIVEETDVLSHEEKMKYRTDIVKIVQQKTLI